MMRRLWIVDCFAALAMTERRVLRCARNDGGKAREDEGKAREDGLFIIARTGLCLGGIIR